MSTDLREFVRDALARGIPRDETARTLRRAGWREDEVNAELDRWADVAFAIPVPRRKPQLSAREAFLYLVLFATLYLAAFNTGAVLFDLIERWLPDALHPRNADQDAAGLRWAVASLIIALPVFVYTQGLIGRAVAADPDKRSSGVRRWLTYLTLFLAALVLIGDFVVVLTNLLKGELIPRFLLKALVVFKIAGAVFRFYLSDLRRDEVDAPARTPFPWLGRAGVVAMALVAVVGLVLLGSPGSARARELDQRRLRNVQALSAAVESYAADYGRLPPSLDALMSRPNAPRPATEVTDPVTDQPFEYAVLDSVHYRLCATFATRDTIGPIGGSKPFWSHPAGRHCFTLELSPRRRAPQP
jgi:uncharacterized protein DUF5671